MEHTDYCAQFIRPSARVLDVGAGRGKFVCEMARRGYQTYGIEINEEYIKEAATRAAAAGVGPILARGTAEHLPYPDASFDFVNCAEVTEHVDNPRQVCQEIFRALKPGAYCYISFHNRFGLYDYHYGLWGVNWLPRSWSRVLLQRFRPARQDGVAGRQTLTTMHYFTFGQVKKLLAGVGFQVKDARAEKIKKNFPAMAFFLSVAYKLILRPFYFNSFHILIAKPV